MKRILLASSILATAYLTCPTASADTINVDVIYPEVSQQSQTLSLVGTVETPNSAALAPLQSGLVAEILVEEGQLVEKHQPLLVLDSELAELGLQQANAGLAAARANADEAQRRYDEIVKLADKQLVAETSMAERRSNVAITEAEVEQAIVQQKLHKSLLARHTLKAPFSGLIARRYADLGEWVTSQNPVFHLIAQDDLRLAVSIPQEYFHQLNGRSDINVEVTPDFPDAAPIKAKLDTLVRSAANSSRTLTGHIELPDSSDLLVGMSARADVLIPESEKAIARVPRSAIKQHPDGGFSVFAAVEGKARQIVVEVIESNDGIVAVSGLDADVPIVATGVAVLVNGADLTITNQSRGGQ